MTIGEPDMRDDHSDDEGLGSGPDDAGSEEESVRELPAAAEVELDARTKKVIRKALGKIEAAMGRAVPQICEGLLAGSKQGTASFTIEFKLDSRNEVVVKVGGKMSAPFGEDSFMSEFDDDGQLKLLS